MDSSEKSEKYNQVVNTYLADVYRISLFLVRDKDLAEKVTRRAFLVLYKQFESVNSELYFAQLVHYARRIASEYQNGSGVKGGCYGKEV